MKNKLLAALTILTLWSCQTVAPQKAKEDSIDFMGEAHTPFPQLESLSKEQVWSAEQRLAQAKLFFFLGEISNLRADRSKATVFFDSAYNLDPNPYTGAKLISSKASGGDAGEALQVARKMSLLYPRNIDIQFLHGQLLAVKGSCQEAVQPLREVISLDPRFEAGYLPAIQCLQSLGKIDEAIALAKSMTNKLPGAAVAWSQLGRLYVQKKDYKSALAAAQKAYDLQTQSPELTLILAITFELNKRSKDAIRFYEKLFKMNFISEALIQRMLEIYRDFGDVQTAFQLIDDLLQVAQEPKPGLIIQKAILLWEIKEFQKAAFLLKDLAASYPESDRVLFTAGLACERVQDFALAKQYYEKIPDNSPLWILGQMRILVLLKTEKKFEEFYAILHQLETKNDLEAEVYAIWAEGLGDEGKFADAVQVLQRAQKKLPGVVRLLFLEGVYYEKAEKISEAESVMRQVIEKDPRNSTALNFLGYMLAERDRNLDEAEQLINRALEIKPNDPFYLDSLGWVYYKRKLYERARATIKAALALMPQEGVIIEHLADVELALGRRTEALALYESALKMPNLEARDRERIQTKLKSHYGPK